MKIRILSSITYSKYIINKKYKWKSKNKITNYFVEEQRIVLRIHSAGLGNKVHGLTKDKRQVNVNFVRINKLNWMAHIQRASVKNLTLTYHPTTKKSPHAWTQVVINRVIPNELKKQLKSKLGNKSKGSITIPINTQIILDDWEDIGLKPWDFLYHTEIRAKELMRDALNLGFNVDYVPKGRNYDLQLITQNGTRFAIAILSHDAKSKSRSKQHRINKTLLDIAKMLPSLHTDTELIPVIISQPFDFDGSWSFTTSNYLNFYQRNFRFNFIFTEFRKDWTNIVCKKLKKIANNIQYA